MQAEYGAFTVPRWQAAGTAAAHVAIARALWLDDVQRIAQQRVAVEATFAQLVRPDTVSERPSRGRR